MTEFSAQAPLGRDPHLPGPQGLYDPANEHDACGVGFVADMKDRKTHEIVQMGLRILMNLDHRGAVGADPKLGDGCGILTQIPHTFFAEECAKLGFNLPEPGDYGIGQFFMPSDKAARERAQAIAAKVLEDEGLPLIGWREVPVDSSDLGEAVREVEPSHWQMFAGRGTSSDQDEFERRLYVARKSISNAVYGLNDGRHGEHLSGIHVDAARSSTRAWCWWTSSATITRTCRTRVSSARWRSSISASPPTRSRPGGWRILTAWLRTTAKSTRCAAT